jgi:hypothetical protein
VREAESTVCDSSATARRGIGRAISLLSASSSGCAVGKGAVQDNGALSRDIGDGDHTLVEGCIAAVAQDILLVLGVVVVVAAALGVLFAKALDWLRLVGVDGDVVEGPCVLVWVRVDGVVPRASETKEKYSGSKTDSGTKEDRGNAAPRRRSSSIWDRSTAAVESATTVGWTWS